MPKNKLDVGVLFFVVFLTLLGGYVRLAPVLAANFPINDGGLFYTMTEDLVANDFRLPAVTSYNAIGMAYAYPPLAFYLGGGLTSVFGWRLLDLFRFLPALVSALSIPAFYLLAGRVLKSGPQVALAVFAFAFMPSAFYWQLMGGGLTRSLGLFFSILALWALLRLYQQHSMWNIVLAGLLTALAILSHPEAALHTLVGALALFAFFGWNRMGFVGSALSAVLTVALTAAWWGTVLANHGAAPFLAAGSTGGYRLDLWLSFFQLNLADEIALTFVGVLAILGMFAQVAKRAYFLPIWALLVILSEPRSAVVHLAPVLALLAGIALDEIVLAQLRALEGAVAERARRLEDLFAGRVSKMFFLYFLVYSIAAAYSVAYTEARDLSLSDGNQAAFAWIKANLAPGQDFLLVTGDQPLADPASEWFPALSGGRSVATVQGFEWQRERDFTGILRTSFDAQLCALQDAECLRAWAAKTGSTFEYIYLDRQRIKDKQGSARAEVGLQKSLLASGQFDIIYETNAVAILKARE